MSARPTEATVNILRSAPLRSYLALVRIREREEGQALVEYAMILLLVAVVCISILSAMGGHVSSMISRIAAGL
jgi:pilus assembly protein Flp/PilA